MDKYTLKTAFKKKFSGIVWRIEIDTTNNILAAETRDEATGNPAFSAFDYTNGKAFLVERPYGDRNWTLVGIAHGRLIVRAFGQNSPDGAGIACIDVTNGELIWEQFNYVFIGMADQQLIVRHRNFASGYEQHLDIGTGALTHVNKPTERRSTPDIIIPQRYTLGLPAPLANYTIHGEILHCQIESKQLFSFHEITPQSYRVRLVIYSGLNILSDEIVLTGLTKMIPELFFAIGRQLFFVGDNKREIVSYLV